MPSLRAAAVLTLLAIPALAKPTGPVLLCERYPGIPECSGKVAACTTCHRAPPERNGYGDALKVKLGADFDASLPAALAAVESLDSDGDGATNLVELKAGTNPGDPASVPRPTENGEGVNPDYAVGQWDPAFAYRRALVAFCGRSPTYAELQALRSSKDPKAHVHQALETCLASSYWREEQLPRFADSRIRPIGPAGTCISMYGNFEPDYFLFTWALTQGHDARELLTAKFHVERLPDGTLRKIDESAGPPQPPSARAGFACTDRYGNKPPKVGGQPLAQAQRAGMLTTQWFLWRNTMGSLVPRGSAAVAYKAWLGYDVSLSEGLRSAPNEPRDIDRRGVGASPCNTCHATLDPLAYAFSYYFGAVGDDAPQYTGTYLSNRWLYMPVPNEVKQSWAANPPRPWLLGQPLPLENEVPASSALVVMGERMAASDEFARTITSMFFEWGVGHAPAPEDAAELEALWKGFKTTGYSADRLLHALVDTHAFGAP